MSQLRFVGLAGAIALAAGVCATGCTALLSTGDYQVATDASADAGSGSDGASGGGDDSTMGPDVAADGPFEPPPEGGSDSATTGMDTGAGSETGVGKDGGPVGCTTASLPVTSAAFKSAVQACVYAESCDYACWDQTISDCISLNYLGSTKAFGCMATATSCSAYQACTGTNLPTTAQCATSSSPAHCTGTLAVNCGVDTNVSNEVQDCSLTPNSLCKTYNDPFGGSAKAAGCALPSTYVCTDTDGLLHCDAHNNLYTCVNGVEYGQYCGSASTCHDDKVNTPFCAPTGPACSSSGNAYSCASATTAEWCNSSVLYSFNCANLGLGCEVDSTTASAECVAPGCTTADVSNCTESCAADGHTANLCIGGVPYAIDCKTFGFNSCDDTTCNYLYCSY